MDIRIPDSGWTTDPSITLYERLCVRSVIVCLPPEEVDEGRTES